MSTNPCSEIKPAELGPRDPAAFASVQRMREALDDLWGCIGVAELKDLQPETVRVAHENHTFLWHRADR
jgi:hypothetical protein